MVANTPVLSDERGLLPRSRPASGWRCESTLLLGARCQAENFGLCALAAGTVASLRVASPAAQISLLDYDQKPAVQSFRSATGNVPVPLLNLRFSRRFWLRNNVARLLALAGGAALLPAARLRKSVCEKNATLRAILRAPVIVSLAGGDSFSDIYGLQRLLYVSLPQILVLWMGKPLFLLPQTYGPFKSRFARGIARYILKRAKLIYSRDQEGIKVVTELLGRPDPRVRFAYDMGFALEPYPPAEPIRQRLGSLKRGRPLAGLNVSGLLYMGGYSRSNMFGLKADYSQTVRAIVHSLVAEHGCDVLLVPHVFGDDPASESDVPACRSILAELGPKYADRLHFIDAPLDHHEIKYVIGQCDFFLGSRMHACIAALSQCVPAVGLAYSRKFSGVLESVGGGSRVLDLCHLAQDEVLAGIRDAFNRRVVLREELLERIPRIKESVLNLFSSPEFKAALADA